MSVAAHDHDQSLSALAVSATLHCLTGCAAGEVVGMAIGTALCSARLSSPTWAGT